MGRKTDEVLLCGLLYVRDLSRDCSRFLVGSISLLYMYCLSHSNHQCKAFPLHILRKLFQSWKGLRKCNRLGSAWGHVTCVFGWIRPFPNWNYANECQWSHHWHSEVGQGSVSDLAEVWLFRRTHSWLVVWTPLKNISQFGWLFPIYRKIKNGNQTTNQTPLSSDQNRDLWTPENPQPLGTKRPCPASGSLVNLPTRPSAVSKLGASIWGYPKLAGWMVYEGKSPWKWMMTGGTPILGNPRWYSLWADRFSNQQARFLNFAGPFGSHRRYKSLHQPSQKWLGEIVSSNVDNSPKIHKISYEIPPRPILVSNDFRSIDFHRSWLRAAQLAAGCSHCRCFHIVLHGKLVGGPGPPLWKRLEFVKWDDDSNPIFMGK